jgi:hypothetical protein
MPMLLTRRYSDHVARPNFLNRTSPALCPSASRRHDQRLTKWVRVPCRPGARFEGDTGGPSRAPVPED